MQIINYIEKLAHLKKIKNKNLFGLKTLNHSTIM